MGEVTAVQQVHAQDGVARVEQGGVDGVVGRRAGKRLDVDKELVGASLPLAAKASAQRRRASASIISAYSTPL